MSGALVANIFVLGLSRKCGKTLVASALVKGLLDNNVKAGFIKPLSLVDTYLDLAAISRSVDLGFPVSMEAVQLSEVDPSLDYDVVNPLVLVSAPPRLETFLEARTPSTYFAYLDDPFKRIFFVKASFPQSIKMRLGYLNEWLLSRRLVHVDDEILRKISRNVDKVTKISIHIDVENFLREIISKAVGEAYERLSERRRVLIVEGVFDRAWPLPFYLRPDIVFIVAQGSVLMFRGDRYAAAVKVKGDYSDMSVLRTRDVIALLNPSTIFHVPPLSTFELIESRMEKLSEVIGAVLDFIES